MRKNKVDLHIHTNESDGTSTPNEVLDKAQKLGLEIISITDHESIEAHLKLQKERFTGIIITGIELKTYCLKREIELLGYCFDIDKMKKLLPVYYKSKEEINTSYLHAIVEILKKKGIKLPEDIKEKYTDKTIQPARYVNERLLEIKEESNIKKLFSDKIQHQQNESLYRGWLSNPQSEFYVEFEGYPKYQSAIQLIKECGGKVSIPHIYQYGKLSIDILEELLKSQQIDMIECYYSTFSEDETNYLLRKCQEYNLLISGGSDYHGLNKKNQLGRGLDNNLYIPVENIRKWVK